MHRLPDFPPISARLLKALDIVFPDALPRVKPSDPSQGIDMDGIAKSVLRCMGKREVVDYLHEVRRKQQEEARKGKEQ